MNYKNFNGVIFFLLQIADCNTVQYYHISTIFKNQYYNIFASLLIFMNQLFMNAENVIDLGFSRIKVQQQFEDFQNCFSAPILLSTKGGESIPSTVYLDGNNYSFTKGENSVAITDYKQWLLDLETASVIGSPEFIKPCDFQYENDKITAERLLNIYNYIFYYLLTAENGCLKKIAAEMTLRQIYTTFLTICIPFPTTHHCVYKNAVTLLQQAFELAFNRAINDLTNILTGEQFGIKKQFRIVCKNILIMHEALAGILSEESLKAWMLHNKNMDLYQNTIILPCDCGSLSWDGVAIKLADSPNIELQCHAFSILPESNLKGAKGGFSEVFKAISDEGNYLYGKNGWKQLSNIFQQKETYLQPNLQKGMDSYVYLKQIMSAEDFMKLRKCGKKYLNTLQCITEYISQFTDDNIEAQPFVFFIKDRFNNTDDTVNIIPLVWEDDMEYAGYENLLVHLNIVAIDAIKDQLLTNNVALTLCSFAEKATYPITPSQKTLAFVLRGGPFQDSYLKAKVGEWNVNGKAALMQAFKSEATKSPLANANELEKAARTELNRRLLVAVDVLEKFANVTFKIIDSPALGVAYGAPLGMNLRGNHDDAIDQCIPNETRYKIKLGNNSSSFLVFMYQNWKGEEVEEHVEFFSDRSNSKEPQLIPDANGEGYTLRYVQLGGKVMERHIWKVLKHIQ